MTVCLEYKPDAERCFQRIEAWWHRQILDRPTIQIYAPQPSPKPLPEKKHATLRERWMDVEYTVEQAQLQIANTYWGGELLPLYYPNLGPDLLAAVHGVELSFGEGTSWANPLIDSWDNFQLQSFDLDNPYTRTILEMTQLALEMGTGKFLVGHTDLHADCDLLVSLRGPENLCIDLVSVPDQVRTTLAELIPSYYRFYETEYDLMKHAGQTITTSWLPLYTEGRYYIPSNDFSCMISNRTFCEFFLQPIIDHVNWLDHSIYHLDGPDALRHLDTILSIEKLDAVQYVWGAGKGNATDWIPVFQKIQDAGKNNWIPILPTELETMMEALRPEGTMLNTWVSSVEEAEDMIQKVSKWI